MAEIYRLGVARFQPFVMSCVTKHNGANLSYVMRTCRKPGLALEVAHILAQRMNVTFITSVPEDNTGGNRQPNGSWTGLMGMITRGEVDVLPPCLFLTELRCRYASCLYEAPIVYDTMSVLVNPKPLVCDSTIIQTFSPFLLLVGILCFVAVILALTFPSILNKPGEKLPSIEAKQVCRMLADYLYDVPFKQKNCCFWQNRHTLLLITFWCGTAFVGLSFFKARFVKSLVPCSLNSIISNLDDLTRLIKHQNYTFNQPGQSLYGFNQLAPEVASYQKVSSTLKQIPAILCDSDKSAWFTTKKHNGTVTLNSRGLLLYETRRALLGSSFVLDVMEQTHFRLSFVFGRNLSDLNEPFRKGISILRAAGIVSKLENIYLGEADWYESKKKRPEYKQYGMTNRLFAALKQIALFGIGAAACSFMLELFTASIARSTYKMYLHG